MNNNWTLLPSPVDTPPPAESGECPLYAPRAADGAWGACPWWMGFILGIVVTACIVFAIASCQTRCMRRRMMPFRDRVQYVMASTSPTESPDTSPPLTPSGRDV